MKRSLFGMLIAVVGAIQGIAAQARPVSVRVMISVAGARPIPVDTAMARQVIGDALGSDSLIRVLPPIVFPSTATGAKSVVQVALGATGAQVMIRTRVIDVETSQGVRDTVMLVPAADVPAALASLGRRAAQHILRLEPHRGGDDART